MIAELENGSESSLVPSHFFLWGVAELDVRSISRNPKVIGKKRLHRLEKVENSKNYGVYRHVYRGLIKF